MTILSHNYKYHRGILLKNCNILKFKKGVRVQYQSFLYSYPILDVRRKCVISIRGLVGPAGLETQGDLTLFLSDWST